MTDSPDPKAVVRAQLALASQELAKLRRKGELSPQASGVLLNLVAATNALADIVLAEPAGGPHPQSVKPDPNRPNIRTMGF